MIITNNWINNIRRVQPYIPGEQPKLKNIIKLNTNENPFPPSPMVEKALGEMNVADLRLYPDPDCTELKGVLADRYGVCPSQVFVGVGSDDVLSTAFLTCFNSSDSKVIFPDITYSFYDVWCAVYGIPFETKPLKDDFTIDISDYLDGNAGGIVLANPNAPTGVCESVESIRKVLDANPQCVVIVDEAYVDFGGESCMRLVDEYDNLLVVQTFSKSRSLAGMRIGFAVGSERLIGCMSDVRNSVNSYTMNRSALVAGVASVRDEEYFRKCCEQTVSVREFSKGELARLGFEFPDSKTNFIFARHKSVPASEIFNKLRERGIFVRHWNKDRISDYLRISIGTQQQMNELFKALEDIVG